MRQAPDDLSTGPIYLIPELTICGSRPRMRPVFRLGGIDRYGFGQVERGTLKGLKRYERRGHIGSSPSHPQTNEKDYKRGWCSTVSLTAIRPDDDRGEAAGRTGGASAVAQTNFIFRKKLQKPFAGLQDGPG